jgi:hypothetical protein
VRIVPVLGSELRIGVKKRAVSNRKQTVVGIQGWVRARNWSPVSNVRGSLAAWLGIRLKIWLEPGPGVLIGLDQARSIPGDKFSSGIRF